MPNTDPFSQEMPKWKINQKPVAYVQQIVMKSMVYPYRKDDLVRTDAFRGPLASAFKLHLEDLTVFQDPKRYILRRDKFIGFRVKLPAL